MTVQEHADLVRSAYEAFSTGDLGVLVKMFAEDAIWHVSGTGGLSGVKHGRDEILRYFGELVGWSGGTLKLELHDVVAGPDHTVGLHHNHAERDGRHLDQNVVLVVHTRDGRFREVWEFHEDQAEYDAFWR